MKELELPKKYHSEEILNHLMNVMNLVKDMTPESEYYE